MSDPCWWQVERDIEAPGWQDGEVTVIDGVTHTFGCVRDSRCVMRVEDMAPSMRHLAEGKVMSFTCDCLCHNEDTLP